MHTLFKLANIDMIMSFLVYCCI